MMMMLLLVVVLLQQQPLLLLLGPLLLWLTSWKQAAIISNDREGGRKGVRAACRVKGKSMFLVGELVLQRCLWSSAVQGAEHSHSSSY